MKHLKMLTIAAMAVVFATAAVAQSNQYRASQNGPVLGPQASGPNGSCSCTCNAGMSDGTGNKQVGGVAQGSQGSGVCTGTPQGPGDGTGIADCDCVCDGAGGGKGARNGGGNGPQPGTGDCDGTGTPGTGTCPNP